MKIETLTRQQIKFIKSLKLKKYREIEHCFVVEGEKNVISIIKSNWYIHHLIVTRLFIDKHKHILESVKISINIVKNNVLRTLGNYKSNEMALAVVRKPEINKVAFNKKNNTIVLDDIRDPGNLGTILRIADWFGIKQIILSPNCTEVWNPKVIASSMGSILNVNIISQPLLPILKNCPHQKWATTLNGKDIHEITFSKDLPLMLVFGNESKGVNKEILTQIPNSICIKGNNNIDSLNVSVVVGIVCDNVFRQIKR